MAAEGLRPADEPDDGRGLERLESGQQVAPVGHVRGARDGRDPRRANYARDEQLDGQRVEMRVGVGDDDELVPGAAKPQVQLLCLATVDRVADDLHPLVCVRCDGRDRGGLVGGAVVEHEDLELRIVDRASGLHIHADHGLLVVRGHQDRHAGPASVRLGRIPLLLEEAEEKPSAHPDPGHDHRVEREEGEEDVSGEAQAFAPPVAGELVRAGGHDPQEERASGDEEPVPEEVGPVGGDRQDDERREPEQRAHEQGDHASGLRGGRSGSK